MIMNIIYSNDYIIVCLQHGAAPPAPVSGADPSFLLAKTLILPLFSEFMVAVLHYLFTSSGSTVCDFDVTCNFDQIYVY